MANDQTTAPRKTAKKTAAKKTATKAAPRARAPRKTTSAAIPPPAQAFPTLPPPGWYVDPAEQTVQRWWDGEGWAGTTLPAGAQAPAGPMADEASTLDPHGKLARLLDGDAGKGKGRQSTDGRVSGQITYRGRRMNVVMPTPDQLAIWQRTATRLQATDGLTPGEIMKLLQRAVTLIGSVLVDEVDRDWVEEALLAGDIDLMGAAAILTVALEELAGKAKAAAPKNGPAPRARRKR